MNARLDVLWLVVLGLLYYWKYLVWTVLELEITSFEVDFVSLIDGYPIWGYLPFMLREIMGLEQCWEISRNLNKTSHPPIELSPL